MAIPQEGTSVSYRCERDIAADAVWSLFAAEILQATPKVIARAAAAARLRPADLRDAKYRTDRGLYRAPRGERTPLTSAGTVAEAVGAALSEVVAALPDPPSIPDPPIPTKPNTAPRHPNTAPASAARRAAKEPVAGRRVCGGPLCKGRLRLLSAFGIKNKATGQLKSFCVDCTRHYQRTRYLSVEKVKLLNTAGLTFVVSEGDNVTGLSCTGCGEPIRAGQEVSGETALHHSGCAGETDHAGAGSRDATAVASSRSEASILPV